MAWQDDGVRKPAAPFDLSHPHAARPLATGRTTEEPRKADADRGAAEYARDQAAAKQLKPEVQQASGEACPIPPQWSI